MPLEEKSFSVLDLSASESELALVEVDESGSLIRITTQGEDYVSIRERRTKNDVTGVTITGRLIKGESISVDFDLFTEGFPLELEKSIVTGDFSHFASTNEHIGEGYLEDVCPIFHIPSAQEVLVENLEIRPGQ